MSIARQYNNDIMGLGRIYGGLVIVASTVDLHSTRKGSIPLSSTKFLLIEQWLVWVQCKGIRHRFESY